MSGFYFAHPEAKYFSVGKIDDDQVVDMAGGAVWRRKMSSAG